eukprot:g20358.t1
MASGKGTRSFAMACVLDFPS